MCYELKRATDACADAINTMISNQNDDNYSNNVDYKNDYDVGDYITFKKKMAKYDLKQAVFSQGNLLSM